MDDGRHPVDGDLRSFMAIDAHQSGACCNACAFSAATLASPPPAAADAVPERFPIVDGRPMGAAVVVRLRGGDEATVVPITTREVRLGRTGDNDVVIRDMKLSRRQATLSFDGEGVWLSDARSGCGTFINGVIIREPTRLNVGDRIYVGDTLVEVMRI
jgi:hypothetical protein